MYKLHKCRENQPHFMFNDIILENCGVYELMWKNTVQPHKPQIKIWLMSKACWMSKAWNTHSE